MSHLSLFLIYLSGYLQSGYLYHSVLLYLHQYVLEKCNICLKSAGGGGERLRNAEWVNSSPPLTSCRTSNRSAAADQLSVQSKSDARHIRAFIVSSVTYVHTAVEDMAGALIKQPVVFVFFD